MLWYDTIIYIYIHIYHYKSHYGLFYMGAVFFYCCFFPILFVFQSGALFLAICYILEQKSVLCWILELKCAICTVHWFFPWFLAGFSMVFIDLPKVFIDIPIVFIEFSLSFLWFQLIFPWVRSIFPCITCTWTCRI